MVRLIQWIAKCCCEIFFQSCLPRSLYQSLWVIVSDSEPLTFSDGNSLSGLIVSYKSFLWANSSSEYLQVSEVACEVQSLNMLRNSGSLLLEEKRFEIVRQFSLWRVHRELIESFPITNRRLQHEFQDFRPKRLACFFKSRRKEEWR